MGIINLIEKNLLQNEYEASESFEDILKEKGSGGTLYLLSEKLPLFINSNWKTINSKILQNKGKIKFALFDKPKLPQMILENPANLDNIKIYKLNQIPNYSLAMVYDKYYLNSHKDKFKLSSLDIGGVLYTFESFFNDAEKRLKEINSFDCFE